MRPSKLRAAVHVHSDWSYDGKWSLEKLAAEFSRRGYQILMTSEHDRGFTEARLAQYREACAKASSDKMFVLPGIEYSDANNTVHVLVWGPVPFLGESLPTSTVLEGVRSANGVAVLAHPSRLNAWRLFDPAWGPGIVGIELWNRKSDGWAPSRQSPGLLKQTGAIAFAGNDFHDSRQFFPLSMTFDGQTVLTEESILDSLRSRQLKACVFETSVDSDFILGVLPFLRLAERGRRILARTYRWLRNTRS